jgi:hypothetical protein
MSGVVGGWSWFSRKTDFISGSSPDAGRKSDDPKAEKPALTMSQLWALPGTNIAYFHVQNLINLTTYVHMIYDPCF